MAKQPIGKVSQVGVVLCWLLLNALMNLNFPAPQGSIGSLLWPSFEVWLLVLGIGLLATTSWARPVRIGLAATFLFIILRLYRFGEVLTPLYFYRPFNLYMDLGYLPDLIHLLYHSFSPVGFWIRIIGALFLFVILTAGIFKAFQVIDASLQVPLHRSFLFALTGGLLAVPIVFLPFHPQKAALLKERLLLPRVAEELQFIWNLRQIKANGLAAVELASEHPSLIKSPLDRLKKADVACFIIESYGETVFADPGQRDHLLPVLAAFEQTLRSNDFFVCSNFLVSPTFGGTSWLALGTLESGVRVGNQMQYNYLLNSRVTPLAAYFNQAGYLTVSIMPGTVLPWPEGEFFGYQRTYYARDFDYKGPAFDWSPMPDQFVLDAIAQKELENRRQPCFLRFELTSSHAPFSRQPPYIADWSRIGDGSIYHALPPVTFPVTWPDLSNATEAYTSSLIYDFKLLCDYLPRYFKKSGLIVILGDHQPNGQLTGDQAGWSVPVHIISSQQDLLQPFIDGGYTKGLIPSQPPPYRGMETFLPDFLNAFSSS
jgi:hypothetical protein